MWCVQMHVTWRSVNYLSCLVSALLNALWMLLFWNIGGLRSPWFAIFIDLGQLFAFSINSMLIRLVVVELALPGQFLHVHVQHHYVHVLYLPFLRSVCT
jgi:hypothetical protein